MSVCSLWLEHRIVPEVRLFFFWEKITPWEMEMGCHPALTPRCQHIPVSDHAGVGLCFRGFVQLEISHGQLCVVSCRQRMPVTILT